VDAPAASVSQIGHHFQRDTERHVVRIDDMAAANSMRSWLPEMIEELVKSWNRSLSWKEYSPICDRMTELRTQLRRERGVQEPRMFCRHCNEVHEMILGPVTVRSVLFALRKRGLLTDEELQNMDAEWRRYRAKHHLDGLGRRRAGSQEASQPIASPISISEKAQQKLTPGTWQHTMLQGNLRALHIALALMMRKTNGEDVPKREDLEAALRAFAEMTDRSQKAQAKFAPGTSQYTLQQNRIRAFRAAEALINAEGGISFSNVTGTVTLLSPLPSLTNLTISGPGRDLLTISGGNQVNVFAMNGGYNQHPFRPDDRRRYAEQ
jgi:hypothetical protein